ncbi:hypothetical protein E2C01_076639 [Portunus trituberculatus]|uniref:Secreted protein n=1 Tax=Portunus trituberculatus TaxID=210409 RepID=A0A5B7IK79_PORTR|nr:hypothetical protein [Portunus trituberculatus]
MRNLVLLTFMCVCMAATLAMPAARPPTGDRDGRIILVFPDSLGGQDLHEHGEEEGGEGEGEAENAEEENPEKCFFILCITNVNN